MTATAATSESDLARALATNLGLPFLADIDATSVDHELLTDAFSRAERVVALRGVDGAPAFVIAAANHDAIEALRKRFGNAPVYVSTPTAMERVRTDVGSASAIAGEHAEPAGHAEPEKSEEYEVVDARHAEALGKTPPAIRMVDAMLSEAVRAEASDVHVEPRADCLLVRYRIDGLLMDAVHIPKALQPSVLSRFKIITRLDISEHRKPQDGRGRLRMGDRRIDMRVSILPSQHGETIVVRLLDSAATLLPLEKLGYDDDALVTIRHFLTAPQGMILVTGPTGSGKTSTLYAALNWLKAPTKSVITLENPIEVQVPGLTQVSIEPKAGVTFAGGLRAILRQDPNVILVGEIRDRETAEIALEAAQTGHLLLSTLHTNDAASSITRLLDLGIEPFLLNSSLSAIIAQRLVRRVCPACAEDSPPTAEALAALGCSTTPAGARFRKGRGCEACRWTGYKGRIALHEIMAMNDEIRALVEQRGADYRIREAARRAGMQTLVENGVAKAARGLTTLDEVLRVTPRSEVVAAPEVKTIVVSAASATPPVEAASTRQAILVIDDDVDTTRLLERLLGDAGYDVTCVGDGIEALLAIGRRRFDLVVSDLRMPNLDGVRLLEMNAAKGLHVPIIVVSAVAPEEAEQKCLELGAVDYLTKPIRKDVLLLRVRRALAAARP